MFRDRSDAGRQLAGRLLCYRDEPAVVLALPRGGVPVGYEIAAALKAPLDLLLVRKIGAPFQPELAVGAIAEGPEPITVVNPEFSAPDLLPTRYIDEQSAAELQEIERRRARYLGGRRRAEIAGRTAIVVDDGIATGATTRAALQAVRRAGPRKLVLAVPVAPQDSLTRLQPEADEIVCLATPSPFWAIGQFYEDFHQVPDDEVIALLQRADRQALATPRLPQGRGGPWP